ncbi:MAG: hypothetical protein CVV42_09050 [Candidatus Riflebacteria bacterium HGW-Riflebacteria-2]|nr:MAG: hypothetical protein CVV42_09050 [Candidatus Riflebacteria bacterium HGW-Riflebacteria-2]
MRKTLAIASITFLQGFRTQTFRIVGMLFVAIMAMTYALRVLSVGHKEMMLRSFGLSIMEISSLLLIIFGCVSSFYRERETRLQAIHLTYVSSFDHVLGRLLGNCLLIGAYTIFATIGCALVLWHEGAWSWVFIVGAWSIFLKLCIICAFCSLFANLFGSPVFASLMTVFIYFAAEYASYPLEMIRRSSTVVPQSISRLVYHLLPNFDKIDLKYSAIHGESVAVMLLVEITLYTLLYMAIVFIPSWRVFARHEH